MERYDYRLSVLEDVRSYLMDNKFQPSDFGYDEEEAYEHYEELMRCADSVTGNGSGSYTFNAWKAEENLCHNLDLLMEAMEEFGSSASDFSGAEWGDVTIRCYLLGECLREVLDEYDWDDPDEDDDLDDEDDM